LVLPTVPVFPAGAVSQPAAAVSQPAAPVSQPAVLVSEPAGSVREPVAPVSQPAATPKFKAEPLAAHSAENAGALPAEPAVPDTVSTQGGGPIADAQRPASAPLPAATPKQAEQPLLGPHNAPTTATASAHTGGSRAFIPPAKNPDQDGSATAAATSSAGPPSVTVDASSSGDNADPEGSGKANTDGSGHATLIIRDWGSVGGGFVPFGAPVQKTAPKGGKVSFINDLASAGIYVCPMSPPLEKEPCFGVSVGNVLFRFWIYSRKGNCRCCRKGVLRQSHPQPLEQP
jgi:hypothetical protein